MSAGGIEIREPTIPQPIIRLRSPASGAKDKGKKQIVAEEDSDSDYDSDDDMVVPVLRPSVEDTLEKGRPVRRKLIFGIPGITDNVVEGGEDETDSSGESMEATSTEEGIHYGRFDQALMTC